MKSLLTSIVILFFAHACLAQTGGTATSGTTGSTSCISTFPYLNDFETSIGWSQSSGDDFDWSRLSGGTPSSGGTSQNHHCHITYNDSTKPSSSTTSGPITIEDSTPPIAAPTSGSAAPSNTGVITEVDSFPPKPKSAILNSPCFDLSNPFSSNNSNSTARFQFGWYIQGAANTLDLELSTDGIKWTTIWSQTGSNSSMPTNTTIDLGPFTSASNLQLRFKGTIGVNPIGATYQGEIWIDNIALTVKNEKSTAGKRTFQETNLQTDLQAFPNPFQQQLSVVIPFVENQTATVALYNLRGQQVSLQTEIPSGEKVRIEPPVRPGIYVLVVKVGNMQYQKKVIKSE